MSAPRILLLGAGGFAGRPLAAALAAEHGGDRVIATTRADLDVTDRAAISAVLADHRPTHVVNLAGLAAPAAAERAEALVAKAKELEGLAKSPVREKVQEAQAKLTAEGNAIAEQFESVVMQVGHLEGLQKAQQERQAELEGEKERLRAIEAAATAPVHARVSVEQEAGQPEATRDHSRGQDCGPGM